MNLSAPSDAGGVPAPGFSWIGREPVVSLPPTLPHGQPWPRITIVTPSYNQGRYIEETIRSVLSQGYPNLEYYIMDGDSTDNTVQIIRKYERWLAGWCSEKDKGQTDAIDKGFRRATGDILAYINSDDVYLPYSFEIIARLFTEFQSVDWITAHACFLVDRQVISPRRRHADAYNSKLMQLGFHTSWFLGIPQQVSTFWRRDLYQKAGGHMRAELWHAMAEDLWYRMSAFSAPVFLPACVACMRLHGEQKSHNRSPFSEIENGRYSFLSLPLRRLLFWGMRTWGLRGLLRATAFNGRSSRFAWNPEKEKWELTTAWAF